MGIAADEGKFILFSKFVIRDWLRFFPKTGMLKAVFEKGERFMVQEKKRKLHPAAFAGCCRYWNGTGMDGVYRTDAADYQGAADGGEGRRTTGDCMDSDRPVCRRYRVVRVSHDADFFRCRKYPAGLRYGGSAGLSGQSQWCSQPLSAKPH